MSSRAATFEQGRSGSTLHVQPMTGMVHSDPKCSVGTARYGTVPASEPDTKMHEYIAAGRSKSCKRCGPTS